MDGWMDASYIHISLSLSPNIYIPNLHFFTVGSMSTIRVHGYVPELRSVPSSVYITHVACLFGNIISVCMCSLYFPGNPVTGGLGLPPRPLAILF